MRLVAFSPSSHRRLMTPRRFLPTLPQKPSWSQHSATILMINGGVTSLPGATHEIPQATSFRLGLESRHSPGEPRPVLAPQPALDGGS